MKRCFVLAVVALGLVFTACDEEENLNSSVWIAEIRRKDFRWTEMCSR